MRRLASPLALLTLTATLWAQAAAPATQPRTWQPADAILQRIKAPAFPDRDFDITAYGAKPDADARKPILDAIAACAKAGGGRVVVPAGTYLCNGPILLQSDVNLHISQGATILFGTRPEDYLVGAPDKAGGVLVRWEGTRCYNYSPLVYAHGQKNIALTGKGTLDGQTSKGWATWKKQQGADQGALRGMGQKGIPIEKRLFGKGHFLRPSLIEPYDCQNVLIEGITVKASPFWTIHPVLCTNVTITGVTVQPGTTNDDGCDPESCQDVLIDGCTFDTRDDNIAIKAGRDNDAWPENGGRACENLLIRNCTFAHGAPGGVSIGSEMSGSVRNVFVENCRMPGASYAFYIKSNPERGGAVEGLWARDITIDRCQFLLKCEMNYKNIAAGKYPPTFSDIRLERITCGSATQAFNVVGLADRPVRGLTLKDITIEKSANDPRFQHVDALTIENVKINGKPLQAP